MAVRCMARLTHLCLRRRSRGASSASSNTQRRLVAVENTRGKIGKKSMIHNNATPKIEIDPETYDVRADGELLICEPSDKLPMAQRYFLF